MEIPFVKMHGLGNDFVLVDCRHGGYEELDWSELAPRLARRRFGVGCDQVLLLCASRVADFRMEIYNADGSRVEMCGNGIRCLARYLRDRGEAPGDTLAVETLGGIVRPRFVAGAVEVDMGPPELEGRAIPVAVDGPVRERTVELTDGSLQITCVSMGNPHAVAFCDDLAAVPVATWGAQLESHPLFPQRTNVEFVQVLAPDRLRMRVWERGAGETPACGSGACAALVAASWTGRCGRQAVVELAGGDLDIRWDGASGRVFMTGPAATVFRGVYRLPEPGRTP